MTIYSLTEIVAHARVASPFYRELYRDVPATVAALAELPIVDSKEFWAANCLGSANRLLAGPLTDGIVFKSGGTTGMPKFSAFTRDEWDAFTASFGRGMAAGGLTPGERVADVFYSGALYASFLFIKDSLERAPIGAVCFPIAGSTDPQETWRIIDDFGVSTIAGVPTSIMTLAHVYAKDRSKYPSVHIRRVLFGGESMYDDQRRQLAEIFPGVRIQSIGYASVDAGLLGYADPACGRDEHRAFSDATVMEIVDDATGETISVTGRPGRLLVTSLTRRLMPIIRYPVGDRAAWIDDPTGRDPRFVLHGRAEEAARVGPVSLYFEDLEGVLKPFRERFGIESYQLVVEHYEELDGLTLRLAVRDVGARTGVDAQLVVDHLCRQRKMLKDCIEDGKIHRPRVEWVGEDRLEVNPRTGKLRRIIDRRYG